MRAPGRTLEVTTTRTASRRTALVTGAALLLFVASSATADLTGPKTVHNTLTAAAPTPAVQELLAERAHRAAAPPAARRITARHVTRITLAQRRAAVNNARRAAVVRFARAQRGKPYRFGQDGMGSYDCSGLTMRALGRARVRLPHSSRAQRSRGVRVTSRNARPGDLVSYHGHVGILVGKWRMVDAPGRGRYVLERRIYRGNGLQFRRLIG